MPMTRTFRLLLAALTTATLAACGGDSGSGGPSGPDTPSVVRPSPANPGQTDFTSENGQGLGQGARSFGTPGAAGGTASATPPTAPGATDKAAAPSGRMGDVEEGDIYKVAGTRLYYLNTYRGFVVYDVTDPK